MHLGVFASTVLVVLVAGLAGAGLGMVHVPVPFVEPGILASVVALGLLVALAADLPVSAGVAIISIFALFHGHAHGGELGEAGAWQFAIGFILATAALHAAGIFAALGFARFGSRTVTRLAGAVTAMGGVYLAIGG